MKEEYVLLRIRQLINEREWTFYRLAKQADISYSTLNNMFQRGNVLSIPTLLRICDGFDITMSEFFDEDGAEAEQMSISDQNILADFHRLKEQDQKLVIVYMHGLLKTAVSSGIEFEEMMQEEAGKEPEMDQEGKVSGCG